MRRKKHADMNALPPGEIPAEEPEKTYFPRQESRPLEKCAPPEPPAERPAREALTRGQKVIIRELQRQGFTKSSQEMLILWELRRVGVYGRNDICYP